MIIVLFNTTPIVGKLVERLTQKRGDTLVDPADLGGRKADVVIVDDSMNDSIDAAKARETGYYTLFVGSRFDEMPQGYDAVIGKPFLPEELNTLLDSVESELAREVDRQDLFDADEAAEAVQAEAEGPLFNPSDVEELKTLLDAVENEEGEEAPSASELQAQIDAALETLEPEAWDAPVEELLYDADAPEPATGNEDVDDFKGIDLHARGVEALQDLMAILSDESVARALKEMGVRIDITFGEKA
jgi:hypothetical protein